jgi:hypothetical protein
MSRPQSTDKKRLIVVGAARKRGLEEGFRLSSCEESHGETQNTSSWWGHRAKRATTDPDILLAQEMNALSLDERESIFEDIHGIPRVVEETPSSVKQALQRLDDELTRIIVKPAYDKAVFLSPKYVNDRKLRLMFLRANGFQANRAATGMVEYFDQKLELFGTDKLGKALTLEDFSEDDKSALNTGSTYCLPSTDRSGRRVFFNFRKLYTYKDRKNQLRVFWYMMMSTLMDDEDAQKKGVVAVVYSLGPSRMDENDLALTREGARIMQTLPVRFASLHYCFDDAMLHPVVSLAKLVVGTSTRLRFRDHFGTF